MSQKKSVYPKKALKMAGFGNTEANDTYPRIDRSLEIMAILKTRHIATLHEWAWGGSRLLNWAWCCMGTVRAPSP